MTRPRLSGSLDPADGSSLIPRGQNSVRQNGLLGTQDRNARRQFCIQLQGLHDKLIEICCTHNMIVFQCSIPLSFRTFRQSAGDKISDCNRLFRLRSRIMHQCAIRSLAGISERAPGWEPVSVNNLVEFFTKAGSKPLRRRGRASSWTR